MAEIIYTAIDDSGERGTTSIQLPDSFSLGQFSEFGVAMATFLDALLGGRVESAELTFGVDISSLTSNVALSTSDVNEIGAFQFRSTPGFPVSVNLPCIDELTVVDGSDDLDQANPAIAAFINAMDNGIAVTLGTVVPCDVAEEELVALDFARERFRASGTRR